MSKILIIDDEVDFCLFVKMTLEFRSNYRVITASNGKIGLKAARRERPDLILLDIMMPGMNGFEVLNSLKKDKKTQFIPVVMLTAKGDDISMKKAVISYCDHYLVKPIEMDALQSAIDSIMSLTRRRTA
jgi:DNA-binding response OmpR family regulator